MRINLGSGLIAVYLLSGVLILAIIFFPSNVLRIIFGIPFLLFIPGYTLLAALFTRQEGISGIERVALSLGLSIALVPLIGLIMNYTPWGIRLEPVLYSVTLFIVITSIIAWIRRQQLDVDERFNMEIDITIPSWGESIRDKVFTIILAIIGLGALAILGYFIASPKLEETFTEFYILGQQGTAENYPAELDVGEEAKIILVIINHENQPSSYRVRIDIDGDRNIELSTPLLAIDEKLEQELSFAPEVEGINQKVEFWLFRGDEVEPYFEDPLYLYIDVRP